MAFLKKDHQRLRGLLWRPTLVASIIAYMASITLISLVIGVYGMTLTLRTGGVPDMERLAAFSQSVGGLGGAVASYLATVGVGFWIMRRHRGASLWNAALIGLWMTLFGSPFILFYPASALYRIQGLLTALLLYSFLALGGALLARHTTASAHLYAQILRALGGVTTPEEVLSILGTHRPSADITHLALWASAAAGSTDDLFLLASWGEKGAPAFPHHLHPRDHSTLRRLAAGETFAFRVVHLPIAEQPLWTRLGVRWGAWIPLAGAESERNPRANAALLIASATQERMSTRLVRFYESLTPTLSLVLEKVRLLQQVSEAAVLEERQRLARELHDTLAQEFTGIIMHLEAAENALDAHPDAARTHLIRARDAARAGLNETRALVWALRPDILQRTPLAEAIRRVAARWGQETGVVAQVQVEGDERPLPGDLDVVILRAVQEALANVRKHAQATRVDLTLTYFDDRILLDVQDDGRGFDPERVEKGEEGSGFGLRAMRERVEARRGELIIESAAGEGTTLALSLPFP